MPNPASSAVIVRRRRRCARTVCGPTTGLWLLVVAATAQGSEREVYQAAAPPVSAARGRGRVILLSCLGTLVCILAAFAIDSFSFETGSWHDHRHRHAGLGPGRELASELRYLGGRPALNSALMGL